MPIKINGATSGSTTIAAPDTGSDETIVLSTALASKLDTSAYTAPGIVLVTTQTFSAVSSVSINGCFTSTYDNYRLVSRINHSTTAVALDFRLRASGSDNTASAYNRQFLQVSNTTVSAGATFNATDFKLTSISQNDVGFASTDIYGPNLARRTPFYSVGGFDNNTIQYLGEHNVTSAFDGFTLFVASGTITGSISVYGYRK